MRILIILSAAAVVLCAGLVGILALAQRRLIYPGAYQDVASVGERAAPAGTEAITVGTADGERLHALWRAPRPGCGVVVSFHGNASMPEFHAERFAADPWRAAGWGVLAPAYRGYPGSTGAPSEEGLIADGLAAVAEARARAPGAPVLLHGHSLGAAVAVAVAARLPPAGAPAGLYLEAPFDSLVSAARVHFPAAPGWLLRDTYRSDARIAGLRGPILIVHGTDDPVVPERLGRRLAEAGKARFEALPGDHVSILGARDKEAVALFGGARACPDAAAAEVR
ncbi:alpha/beta hydrolase [Methylobacterium radiodurans]|uniref:Alpha/beta hydrolase n=1 Tax=Methylobacterium radiodurans TaxID=2202828 RepID=A0A2U8VTI0_9HYPH|nr:alpha/beta hydrolase [Methylobacterium radiodurans]AWN36670.1 alpha/beta hydrolase [Methylobacterium radiodurans]